MPRRHSTRGGAGEEPWRRYFLRPGNARPGHAIEVLFDGRETFPSMLEAIRCARLEILLEMYTWLADPVGLAFIDALAERARAGVHVKTLVDGFGSLALPDWARARLTDAGVELEIFHPMRPWKPRWAWAVRDHRKLLVVDRAVAFTGGLNLTNEYAPPESGGGEWHDVCARVRGPAVHELREHFFSAWRHATGLHLRTRVARLPALPDGPASGAPVQVLAISRFRGRRRIRNHYRYAVRQARSTVRIMMGYFIPDRGWRRVLRNAVRRGVDVRLMFPHVSDVAAVKWATRATYSRLLRAGVRIYEWLPSMMHAKALSIDGAVCSVGTYNLDWRSFKHNWELSLLIADAASAARIEERFAADLARCIEIDPVRWSQRGFRIRLIERFFYLLRRLL
jgi:cardiolipin synthase